MTDALRERLRRPDAAAYQIIEAIVPELTPGGVALEAIKHTKAQWQGADSTAGFQLFDDGGVQLAEVALSAVDSTTFTAGQYITDLDAALPHFMARVLWGDTQTTAVELLSITARLNPARGGAQEVARWICQCYAGQSVSGGFANPVNLTLTPIGSEISVAAPTAEQDVVFSWAGNPDKPRPKYTPPGFNFIPYPGGFAPLYVHIRGIKGDGSAAAHVGWALDTAITSYLSGSGNGLDYRQLDGPLPGTPYYRGGYIEGPVNTLLQPAGVPRLKVTLNTGVAATITFTTNPCDLGAVPTQTVELVGRSEIPLGTSVVYEVRADDNTWLVFHDQDTTDDVTAANPSHPVTKRQTYAVRATLNPSVSGDGTPTLRELGVRSIARVDVSHVAAFSGGDLTVDPETLKCNVAQATLQAITAGDPDYRETIYALLFSYYRAEFEFQLYYGSHKLPRSQWLVHSRWLLQDYSDRGDGTLSLNLVSMLMRLRVVLPRLDPNTGFRTPLPYTGSIADAWTDLIRAQMQLPDRLIGAGPTDSTAISKTIPANLYGVPPKTGYIERLLDQQSWQQVQGKDELDGLAYLAGGTNIPSQGRIKYAPLCEGSVAVDPTDGAKQIFLLSSRGVSYTFAPEEIEWVEVSPGYGRAVPEFYVPYGWDYTVQRFPYEYRGTNDNALARLGLWQVDSLKELSPGIAQWIAADGAIGPDGRPPTSTLARRIASRQITVMGSGVLVWRFRCTYQLVELEVGDVVVVPTDRFVAKDPILGRVIAGWTTAGVLATIVGTSADGRQFDIWIRVWTDVGPTTVTGTRLGGPGVPVIPTPVTDMDFRYASSVPVANHGYLAWRWRVGTGTVATLYKPDGSVLTIPPSSVAGTIPRLTPTLSQVAGGSLGARTRYVRIALLRSGLRWYGYSATASDGEASFSVSANNRLKVASPPAQPGFDGWQPLVGSSANGEVTQSTVASIPFGQDWTEPTAGADVSNTVGTPWNSTDWNGAAVLIEAAASTTYYFYPYWDAGLNAIGWGYSVLATLANASAVQYLDGHYALSTGALQAVTPAVAGTSSGNAPTGGGPGGNLKTFL